MTQTNSSDEEDAKAHDPKNLLSGPSKCPEDILVRDVFSNVLMHFGLECKHVASSGTPRRLGSTATATTVSAARAEDV